MLLSVVPPSASLQGFERVTLNGTDFGTTQYFGGAYIGSLRLRDCVITRNHTEITCFTPPGAGIDLHATVIVEGQTSDPSVELFGYKPPVVTSYWYLPSCVSAKTCGLSGDAELPTAVPTSGGVIALVGSNFGGAAVGLQLLVGEDPLTKGMLAKTFEENCPIDLPGTVISMDDYCVVFQVTRR